MISSDEAYRQAGVDLKSADAVVNIARQAAQKTQTGQLLTGIGGFSGAFELPPGYQHPVLLTACDGVGTKLKLAFALNRHDTVGIDLVAMSVNDILVNGGKPLAFLDYLATGKIDPECLAAVLSGVAVGCQMADCALAGGETAEMPGFYTDKEYDLAGFCVGVAEKDQLYPKQVRPDDQLIGLSSSGFHSNGYSLIRKILAEHPELPLDSTPSGWTQSIGDALLAPTRIYVRPVLRLLQDFPEAISAMVHVTGGGFYDNIPRVLPPDTSAMIQASSWNPPPVVSWLQALGNLSNEAMWHTFNCGIGFILVVRPTQVDTVLQALNSGQSDFTTHHIGALVQTPEKKQVIIQ